MRDHAWQHERQHRMQSYGMSRQEIVPRKHDEDQQQRAVAERDEEEYARSGVRVPDAMMPKTQRMNHADRHSGREHEQERPILDQGIEALRSTQGLDGWTKGLAYEVPVNQKNQVKERRLAARNRNVVGRDGDRGPRVIEHRRETEQTGRQPPHEPAPQPSQGQRTLEGVRNRERDAKEEREQAGPGRERRN